MDETQRRPGQPTLPADSPRLTEPPPAPTTPPPAPAPSGPALPPQQPPAPTSPPPPPPPSEDAATVLPEKHGPPKWPLLLFLALLLIAVIGGYVVYLQRSGEEGQPLPTPTVRPFPTPRPTPPLTLIEQLQQQGTSDEIDAIEEDVNATDLSGLDDGLETIETDLLNL